MYFLRLHLELTNLQDAQSLNVRREEIPLVVHGVGLMKTQVNIKRYLLKIKVKSSKDSFHQMICYRLNSITDIHKHVFPEQLRIFFFS